MLGGRLDLVSKIYKEMVMHLKHLKEKRKVGHRLQEFLFSIIHKV